MSMEDVMKSLLPKEPEAGIDNQAPAETDDNADPTASEREPPKPNEPDPEEVQYPSYFKDGGSL